MPIHVEVDKRNHVRLITLLGVIDDAELLQFFSNYWKSSTYDSSLDELYDMTGLEVSQITSPGLRELANANLELNRHAPGVKSAVVAPRDLVYGLNRMYQVFVEDSPTSLQVFRDLPKARQWLGLPESSADE